MLLKVNKSGTGGIVKIPGSKSHTIRALFISSLADGKSVIRNPLLSSDTLSAVDVCRAFGAKIEVSPDKFIVNGTGGHPKTPDNIVDVGNSGTTLRIGAMTAALADGYTVFTGDYQIRSRPMAPLISVINNLGGAAISTKGNGSAPIVIKGRALGGYSDIDAVSSQFLTSVLLNSPLLLEDTIINVTRLNEEPYVAMTLWWLDKQGIKYENKDFKVFAVKGNQSYKSFEATIPGDFSSATFFMVLAAISNTEYTLNNLDLSDPQGDKMVLGILESMGAKVSSGEGYVKIKGDGLKGIEIDMNSIPDALPAMAVAACFAEGETRLLNVPQARLKECDRIHAMYEELKKMDADIHELPDGLIVRKSRLNGCKLNGHDDHRVVMALAVAGLNSDGDTIIDTAEAINITFPKFVDFIRDSGGNITMETDK